jgi:hypothetical protein
MHRFHLRPVAPAPQPRPAKEIALAARRLERRLVEKPRPPKPAA